MPYVYRHRGGHLDARHCELWIRPLVQRSQRDRRRDPRNHRNDWSQRSDHATLVHKHGHHGWCIVRLVSGRRRPSLGNQVHRRAQRGQVLGASERIPSQGD